MPDTAADNRRFVDALERAGHIRSALVREAFLSVDRSAFVPSSCDPFVDESIVTKRDSLHRPISSSSRPSVMALMLEELDLAVGLDVLEVGTGTGFNAALLSRIVGQRVTSVDVDRQVASAARSALRAVKADVKVIVRDGAESLNGKLFDRIVVTASTDRLPKPWFDQLRLGGLLVVPICLNPAVIQPQLIVTFRKMATTLNSIRIRTMVGGFMSMRTDDAARDYQSFVATAGNERLATLTGNGLSALSPQESRALLSLTLGPVSFKRLPAKVQSGHRADLRSFIAGEIDKDKFVVDYQDGGISYGCLSKGGKGFARLVERGDSIVGVEWSGSSAALGLMERTVARWVALGRPGVSRLRLVARPTDAGAGLSVRRSWVSSKDRPSDGSL